MYVLKLLQIMITDKCNSKYAVNILCYRAYIILNNILIFFLLCYDLQILGKLF